MRVLTYMGTGDLATLLPLARVCVCVPVAVPVRACVRMTVVDAAVGGLVLVCAGPECMFLSTTTTINRWFVRHRGKVTIIRSVEETILVSFPALARPLIHRYGWRGT